MSPATRFLLGGFLTLAVVMGVGRFYYTPLLPLMQRDYGFDAATAGLIASANFAGYLLGSLVVPLIARRHRLAAFRLAAIGSVVTTAGMGVAHSLAPWLVLRGLSGVASAVAMIFAAGFVTESFAAAKDEGRVGWMFGGVGFGIAGSTLLVRLAADSLGSAALWIAAGAGTAVLLVIVLMEVGERQLPVLPSRTVRQRRVVRPFPFAPLLASYFCEGLGYSVFATFIVAIIKARPGLFALADWSWVVVGLAALASAAFWSFVGERIGYAKALLAAFVAQAIGITLPAASAAPAAAIVAAVLFGGTFLGTTILTLPLGRHGLGGHGFAVLTAAFGLGQMLGPLMAGQLIAGPADYGVALLVSAGVVAAGAACLVVGLAMRGRAAAVG